jgi:hypothetical protein
LKGFEDSSPNLLRIRFGGIRDSATLDSEHEEG